MKNVVKLVVGTLLLFILFIFIMVYFGLTGLNAVDSKVAKRNEEMKSYVGKKVVMGRDTLVVTDYKFVGNTYILNGQLSVDAKFVEDNYVKLPQQ